jgi:hypothetical protein
MRSYKIKRWPVRLAMCLSCPFREGGDKTLAAKVLERTLLQSSQICHHPRMHGEKEHELCKGARMYQLELLARLGWLDEPTEEAFRRKSIELGVIEDHRQ